MDPVDESTIYRAHGQHAQALGILERAIHNPSTAKAVLIRIRKQLQKDRETAKDRNESTEITTKGIELLEQVQEKLNTVIDIDLSSGAALYPL